MNHPILLRLFQLFITFIVIFSTSSCQMEQEKPTHEFNLLDLLITSDNMQSGWRIEFPSDYITGTFYPDEAAKIVFVPDTGSRRASVQYIYRFSSSKEAEFRLHNNFIPETLNTGEFVPEGWVHPSLSANEDKFVCYWKAFDVDQEKNMLCKWTARYDEIIVEFISWVLPELMSLDQIKNIIVEIDQKIAKQLRDIR